MRFWIAALIACLAGGAYIQPARAQPNTKSLSEAKRLFRAGARAYQAGKLTFAIKAFDEAYDIAPSPALRFSAAQALRKQYNLDKDVGKLDKAKRYYAQYLSEVSQGGRRADAAEGLADIDRILATIQPAETTPEPPTEPKSTLGRLQIESDVKGARGAVDGHVKLSDLPLYLELAPGTYRVRIEAPGYMPVTRTVAVQRDDFELVAPPLSEKPAVLTIVGDDGADIVVDGRLIGRTPMTTPLELKSGSHSIAVGSSGHDPMVQLVDLERGEELALQADLGITTQRIVAWSMFGGATLAAGAGIVVTILAVNRQRQAQEILDASAGRALTMGEAVKYNGHVETRDNLTNVAGGGFSLAALAGGVGLLLYLLDDPDLYTATAEEMKQQREAPEETAPLELEPTLDGAVLTIRGRF